ncbi:MAG: YbbR-like domain-containing protein [Bacteroidaceae bacterium]|nr:YbbR-like domain-containing protein [Bacteroidaceae bacterium]
MNEKSKNIIESIRGKFHSPGANVVMQFLMFVAISLMFWALMELNNPKEVELKIPIELIHKPDSITMISTVPKIVTVTVRDKGMAILRYNYYDTPRLKCDFLDYNDGEGIFKISTKQLHFKVRQLLDNESELVSVLPDSIYLKYTDLPGKLVPIRMDVDFGPELGFEVTGRAKLSHDSVMVYGTRESMADISEVYTFRVVEKALRDTLRREVGFAPLKDVRIEPHKVVLTVPVEPLVRTKVSANITVRNAPKDVNVITFPSTTKISYLIPRSLMEHPYTITAVVNYDDILEHPYRSKVHVMLGESPAICKDVVVEVDSVDYLVEKQSILDEK